MTRSHRPYEYDDGPRHDNARVSRAGENSGQSVRVSESARTGDSNDQQQQHQRGASLRRERVASVADASVRRHAEHSILDESAQARALLVMALNAAIDAENEADARAAWGESSVWIVIRYRLAMLLRIAGLPAGLRAQQQQQQQERRGAS